MSIDQAHGEIEQAARLLDAHPDYRVLRRLTERPLLTRMPLGAKKAVVLDVEATGIDISKDEILELGMVSFAYSPEGEILGVLGVCSWFNEPSSPITAEITKLTGITDEMVRGATIDPAEVEEFAGDADLIIAHNAAYDRPMVERFWPIFVSKCWACTMTEIDWKSEGFEGMKLGLLLMQSGLFHTGHRATSDCHAAIELLARPLPGSGRSGMSLLLERARRTQIRISAVGAPFEAKDLLKQRGYRWTGQEREPQKAWQMDVLREEAEAELTFLRNEVYRGRRDPLCSRVSAFSRYSTRVEATNVATEI
ncbi:3'-5' exonuclease [Sphingomonas sp. 3-13AW]|uniref:3'-5' exonuclease n=1 Tax=Sphingomonas sp. 3-13AW TaxID=3050450 RepID=UPI003BB6F3DB